MQQYDPIAKHLVLVGGGHSHVILIRMLAMRPIAGLQVTLISPDVLTPYSGMLPGVVAGHYHADDIHIDLVPLCRFAGVRFIRAAVTSIDPIAQVVGIAGRPEISYDTISINAGITPSEGVLKQNQLGVVAVKPISSFLARFEDFLDRVSDGEVKRIAIVGAGAGGVELCLALAHRLHRVAGNKVEVYLLCEKDHFLKQYPEKVQRLLKQSLLEHKVKLHPGFRVAGFNAGILSSDLGDELDVDEVFWATHAGAPAWLANTGLPLSGKGFIKLRDTLQSTGFDNVFAAGDIADVVAHPRPKAGVYAVRQGPILYRNIKQFLLGKKVQGFKPQSDFLSLLSTGGQFAIGSKNGFTIAGRWVWWWKNWIDKRFMDRFQKLPTMKREKADGLLAAFDDQMQCGGCGSKISGDLLHQALADIDMNPAQLDDAAIYPLENGKVMLHSLDSFKAMIDDPYILAQIAVQHALSDIYAMGATAETALSNITVKRAKPSIVKDELKQLLAGAKKALDADGVKLIGGHSTEGAELSIGFAVNGVGTQSELMTKSGAEVGDFLVLTKPLGSGVLFAADMQHKAEGHWIDAALGVMLQSNRKAAEVFTKFNVKCCTDVTGFGLAGHLSEILQASNLSAQVDVEHLPPMAGAVELLKQGFKSTLHEGNQRSVRSRVDSGLMYSYYTDLIYDPQTSGGLLATVAESELEAVLAELHDAGYGFARSIGRIGVNTIDGSDEPKPEIILR